jgi:hypothetical protein
MNRNKKLVDKGEEIGTYVGNGDLEENLIICYGLPNDRVAVFLNSGICSGLKTDDPHLICSLLELRAADGTPFVRCDEQGFFEPSYEVFDLLNIMADSNHANFVVKKCSSKKDVNPNRVFQAHTSKYWDFIYTQ